jgi:uncharacterized protein (DUF169 family)
LSIYQSYAERIEAQLRPASYPIAIKMLSSIEEIPTDAKQSLKHYGKCMATCQCFALSRKNGETIAQLFEDMWCPEPVIGFGLEEPPQYFLDGHNRYPDGVSTLEAGANWAKELPRLEPGKYIGLVSAPLLTASFEPDVAVIYCNSAQLLRLLLGIAYEDGKDITTVLGGHSACVYSVVPTLVKNICQVAVPCRGDRGRAGAQDDEMIFSVPRDQIGRLAYGLEQDGTGAYPTSFSMEAEYNLSESYAEIARLMRMKKGDGTEIKGYSKERRDKDLQYQ